MSHSEPSSDLPLVLQVGFSGSRTFLAPERAGQIDLPTFERELERYLVERLARLPTELGLPPQQFICGICQLAVGGDTLFVQACRRIGAPVRIFLPQPPDVFFLATGDQPDFTPAQKAAGEAILASPDIAQVRVIGEATGRSARFQAVNQEIARVSDVSICLVRANAEYNAGGTLEFLAKAQVRRRPVLKIVVDEANGHPSFTDEWIDRDQFVAPKAPASLSGPSPISQAAKPSDAIPALSSFLARLRASCHEGANRYRDRFTAFANIIIGTHIAATTLALLALTLHGGAFDKALPLLLVIELACLAAGFGAHWLMHKLHLAKNWAQHRLVLQLASSVEGVAGNHLPLDFLFQLPMPTNFRSLLRTLNVLHLRGSRQEDAPVARDWETRRDRYLSQRVGDQHKYYERQLHRSRQRLRFFHYAFTIFSFLAIVATGAKLGIIGFWPHGETQHAAPSDPVAPGAAHSAASHAEDQPHAESTHGDTLASHSTTTTGPTTSGAIATESTAGAEPDPESGSKSGSHAGGEAHVIETITTTLGALAVLLPVLAVGMMSIAAAHDLEGRLHTYEEMAKFLGAQSTALAAASSNEDFVHLMVETESRLLGETVNWLSRRSFTGVA